MTKLYGGVELGGTKNVCAIGDGSGEINNRITIPTTTPAETIPKIIAYFKERHKQKVLLCFIQRYLSKYQFKTKLNKRF